MTTLHIIGNWKMNPKTSREVEGFIREYGVRTKSIKNVNHLVCPPYIYLSLFKKNKKITFGAQDVHHENEGAYTGGVSVKMVSDSGATYVIIGHSERRRDGDTNEVISKKIEHAVKSGLRVVVCVGEKSREGGADYHMSIKRDLEESLSRFPKTKLNLLTVAYEPVWAIGKSAIREATPEESREMSIFIKKVLTDLFDKKGGLTPVLYGGSVNVENCEAFLRDGGVEGLLVGRDSLNPLRFSKIVSKASVIAGGIATSKKVKK